MLEMTRTMVAPYTAIEAWAYDTFLAPAVETKLTAQLEGELKSIPPGASLLDVGCGGGQLLLAVHALRPDLRLTGLDLAPGQIQRARARTREASVAADFHEGSALQLPFGVESFDAVVSVASIKHWPDQALGLREIHRVLRPGGSMLVVEVDRGCQMEDVRDFTSHFRLPAPLRALAVPLFRTYVAGQSLDLIDARALAQHSGWSDATVERIAHAPAWRIYGHKHAAPARAAGRRR